MTSSYLSKPILTKKTKVQQGSGFTATFCEMQGKSFVMAGWRKSMEDSIVYKELSDEVHLFAVCDGHGGAEVAQLVGKMLPETVAKDSEFKAKNYSQALTNSFKKLDEFISSAKGEEQLRALNKSLGGKAVGPEQKIGYRAGTTLVVVLLTRDRYYVANAGDSRAILSRNHQAVTLSNDHKPDLPSEKDRIEKAGGYVHNGRVNASLALSRSLGDFEFKHFSNRSYEEQAVTSLPEVMVVERRAEDNFVLLGCDGVWQRYAAVSQKMVDHLKNLRSRFNNKEIMQTLLNDLVAKDCKQLLGCDNMSGILIEFC